MEGMHTVGELSLHSHGVEVPFRCEGQITQIVNRDWFYTYP